MVYRLSQRRPRATTRSAGAEPQKLAMQRPRAFWTALVSKNKEGNGKRKSSIIFCPGGRAAGERSSQRRKTPNFPKQEGTGPNLPARGRDR
jgi:hypothetical protein